MSTETGLEWLSLPDVVTETYKKLGVERIFPWQSECLSLDGVLDGTKNLIYSAPTSAGKTLVAEIIVIKRYLATKKKALIILPFVSVSREKMTYFQKLFASLGLRIGGYMGSMSPVGGFSKIDVAVCTIEKGNSLVNRLTEREDLDEIGLIVVDELHMIGDNRRGYLLELLLTKLLFHHRRKTSNRKGSSSEVQIVGMSATLPNLRVLADWLEAAMYETDFRPIPITELVKVGAQLIDPLRRKVMPYRPPELLRLDSADDDDVIALALEPVLEGKGCLIFCPTKVWCEQLADSLAREIFHAGQSQSELGLALLGQLNADKLKDCIEQLRRCPAGLDPCLARTVPCGVAYHHAGLTIEERDILECAFRRGALRLLVATSTLSSGVNLPARRVIVRTPIFHAGQLIETATYRQMVGRAGRQGLDTEGQSILICKPKDKGRLGPLMEGGLPPLHSCLWHGDDLSPSLKRAVLEVIANGTVSDLASLQLYLNSTMMAAELRDRQEALQECVRACLQQLKRLQLVEGEAEELRPTHLGSAVLASALGPDEGLVVFCELEKVRRCVALDTDLHLVYMATPVYLDVGGSLDWYRYLDLLEELGPAERRVAQLVGIEERFLVRCVRGLAARSEADRQRLRLHRRFFTALALHDLVLERSLAEVAHKFGVNRGALQGLQQQAATFAGMVSAFCSRLGWSHLHQLLSAFHARLTFGVQRELVDLVRVELVNGGRARALHRAGLATVSLLATARVRDVERVLLQSLPFERKPEDAGSARRGILGADGQPLTEREAARLMVQDARRLLQLDLANLGVEWSPEQLASPPDSPLRVVPEPAASSQASSANIGALDRSAANLGASQASATNHTASQASEANNTAFQASTTNNTASQASTANNTASLATATNSASQPSSTHNSASQASTTNNSASQASRRSLETLEQIGALLRHSLDASSRCLELSPVRRAASRLLRDAQASEDSASGSSVDAPFQGREEELDGTRSFACSSPSKEDSQEEPCGSASLFPEDDSFDLNTQVNAILDAPPATAAPPEDFRDLLDGAGAWESFRTSTPGEAAPRGRRSASTDGSLSASVLERLMARAGAIGERRRSAEAPSPIPGPPAKRPRPPSRAETSDGDIFDSSLAEEGVRQVQEEEKTKEDVGQVVEEEKEEAAEEKDCEEEEEAGEQACALLATLRARLGANQVGLVSLALAPSGFVIAWEDDQQHFVRTNDGRVMAALCQTMDASRGWPGTWLAWDVKALCSRLLAAAHLCPSVRVPLADPAVAAWMLSPEGAAPESPRAACAAFAPDLVPRLEAVDAREDMLAAGAECQILRILWPRLERALRQATMLDAFRMVEMPCMVLLAKTERNGFEFDRAEMQRLKDCVFKALQHLETEAYAAAGRRFNLSSPQEASDVLFSDLHLPVGGIPGSRPSRSKARATRRQVHSTCKAVLVALRPLHRLPGLLLEWRRLSSLFSHNVLPLQACARRQGAARLHGRYEHFTATGRIVMTSPNFQGVPKPFNVTLGERQVEVNLRGTLRAAPDRVLLSLDYSQLELRLLAHLSGDAQLCSFFRAGGDAFRNIAAGWRGKTSDAVTQEERQQAKQVCYGVIYGMGAASLAEELGVSGEQAQEFISAFMASYPAVQIFLTKTVERCRRRGYVTTLFGRRRYLPAIHEERPHLRAHAERQAVNTTVQGSAADIVKKAMLEAERSLCARYPCSRHAIGPCPQESCAHGGTGVFLLLHLHDELLFEMEAKDLQPVARLLRRKLEGTVQLRVPLPVRMRSGTAWGALQDFCPEANA